ncbi:MAG: hypothetical protein ACI8TP_004882, partial [Acidimicrobiales bacterium]
AAASGGTSPSGPEINPLPRPHQRIPKRSLTSHDTIFGPHRVLPFRRDRWFSLILPDIRPS